ncbi:uncharacterized protein LOC124133207 isoform X1 [Haliotis rufescens]|uniref:uncharacterized protein LOC124133207 isoform X1 n=1 Tax=Haliotis rufescens TaxID=6454 RepID=UPI001EB0114F|nr:uncharacterized protein LOC124133207 isoform X1 [Haliotis rufescens]XP_046353456.1 uncharacterized protein LOC124133207 isoform X1 [Haliotis rufescens]XP_046353457.1 uncharacterized protein LOC124133207 isoform X1 [Haliotis rufescens]XP_046353458.1 uncharacterized protein LOC124133207 isoform X1 [Haliotis rufescens]XP_046353459.1 uncharacterized protein LOC124133207 isoform X1 [Haliotis rufescens]XP_046353460.1 uncharacterized protein LOC124133207 isoform X1 [Haliotis rufescens]XP_04635346
MPPATNLRMPCSTLLVTTEVYNTTRRDTTIDNDDRNALLYIVVTLLFYSLGIVVGIITYLKREKREMEESKTFEMFMSLKRDPFTATKLRRVQIVTERLEQLEKSRAALEMSERMELERLMSERSDGEEGSQEEEDRGKEGEQISVQSAEDTDVSERPTVLGVSDSSSNSEDDPKRLQLQKQGNVFQVSPSGEPISSVVAKIFDSERRGGLPNSPKALHLFNSRGRLSRDQSLDSGSARGRLSRDQSVDVTSTSGINVAESKTSGINVAESKTSGNSAAESKSPPVEPEGCLVTNV